LQNLVDADADLFDRAREVAVFVDVSDDFVGEEHLARREVEQGYLIAQMVAQVAAVDRDGLEVLLFLALLGLTAGVEAVEQDLLPIDLVGVLLLLGGRLRLCCRLLLFFLLGLHHLEEWIVEELLLEVLLEIEQWHVKQIHRLIQAWIDLQLLAELRALMQAGLHATSPLSCRNAKRERKRAVSVGPR